MGKGDGAGAESIAYFGTAGVSVKAREFGEAGVKAPNEEGSAFSWDRFGESCGEQEVFEPLRELGDSVSDLSFDKGFEQDDAVTA